MQRSLLWSTEVFLNKTIPLEPDRACKNFRFFFNFFIIFPKVNFRYREGMLPCTPFRASSNWSSSWRRRSIASVRNTQFLLAKRIVLISKTVVLWLYQYYHHGVPVSRTRHDWCLNSPCSLSMSVRFDSTAGASVFKIFDQCFKGFRKLLFWLPPKKDFFAYFFFCFTTSFFYRFATFWLKLLLKLIMCCSKNTVFDRHCACSEFGVIVKFTKVRDYFWEYFL